MQVGDFNTGQPPAPSHGTTRRIKDRPPPSANTNTNQSSTSYFCKSSAKSTSTNTSVDSAAPESIANQRLPNHIAKKKRQTQDLWGVGSHTAGRELGAMPELKSREERINLDGVAQWLEERSRKKEALHRDSEGPWNAVSCIESRGRAPSRELGK